MVALWTNGCLLESCGSMSNLQVIALAKGEGNYVNETTCILKKIREFEKFVWISQPVLDYCS